MTLDGNEYVIAGPKEALAQALGNGPPEDPEGNP